MPLKSVEHVRNHDIAQKMDVSLSSNIPMMQFNSLNGANKSNWCCHIDHSYINQIIDRIIHFLEILIKILDLIIREVLL